MSRLHFGLGDRWFFDGHSPATPDASQTDGAGASAIPIAGVETSGGQALSWANPTQITVAVATHNNSDQGLAFSTPLPPNAITLLYAAEDAWEAVANVHFVNTGDYGTSNVSAADIRVGLSTLSSMGFIGYTSYSWDANDNFRSGTVVALDDVGPGNVAALGNGNSSYVGYQATVFQDLLHELGHALGLAHNVGRLRLPHAAGRLNLAVG